MVDIEVFKNTMFKLKTRSNLGVVDFTFILMLGTWQPFSWFLVMADIQDGQ